MESEKHNKSRDIINCHERCYFYISPIEKCSAKPDTSKSFPDCLNDTQIGKPCIERLTQEGLNKHRQLADDEGYRDMVIRDAEKYLDEQKLQNSKNSLIDGHVFPQRQGIPPIPHIKYNK